MRDFLTVIAVLLSTSCTGTVPPPSHVTPVNALSPINVSQIALDTLVFAGVDMSPFVGVQVGHHHDGFLKVQQYALTARAPDLQAWTSTIQEMGQRTLRTNGYPIQVTAQMFSQWQNYQGARFVLAGRATEFEYNSYGALAGRSHRAALGINWELFDTRTRRVLYSNTHHAAASVSRSESVTEPILRDLLSQLLADSQFVHALRVASDARLAKRPSIIANRSNGRWRRSIPNESELIVIRVGEKNPSTEAAVFGRVADAVISLRTEDGSGSGFFITKDGLAVTNHHVIANAQSVIARLRNGREYPVRVIRSDEAADVALIEVACHEDCLTVDWSDVLPSEGREVYAIGNPVSESLNRSITKGIVSGIRRRGAVTLLQTDAAVSPGNSGGPLVSVSTGQVLGIVSSKIAGSAIEGIGFAVWIPDAMRVLGIRH